MVQGVMIAGAEAVASVMPAAAAVFAAALPAVATAALRAGGAAVPARVDERTAEADRRHQGERSGTAESVEGEIDSRSLHGLATPHHQ
jgi:hypothetical protein